MQRFAWIRYDTGKDFSNARGLHVTQIEYCKSLHDYGVQVCSFEA